MADEALMDVFINILPDAEVLKATEGLVDAAVTRIREKFLGLQNSTIAQGKAAAQALASITVRQSGGGRSSAVAQDADAAKELADRYREAVRAAEDATAATRQLGVALKSIGNKVLSEDFENARLELNGILTDIRRGATDKDPLALDESLKRLILIQNRLDTIRSKSGPALAIRQQFEDAVAGERNQRGEFKIESRLQQSLTRGQPSGQLRQDIAKATAEVQRLEREFDQLVRSFDGSAAHLERLNTTFRQLNVNSEGIGARSGMRALQADASKATTSMNGLTNNAYQLGQAFEDAAVGFSLNGVAGAVRGASNNISFLINNLVQAKAAAGQLTGAFARQIPLIAGVGAAVGLLVIPPLAEWLESLDDIETKTKDISEELKRAFNQIDFNVGLGIETSDLRRQLAEAASLEQIIDKIKDLNSAAENGKTTIREFFKQFEETGKLDKVRDSLRDATGAVTDTLSELKTELESRLSDEANFPTILGAAKLLGAGLSETTAQQIADAKKLSAAYGDLAQAVEVTRLDLKEGLTNPDQLRDVQNRLTDIREQVLLFAKSADLADEKFGEKQIANLDTLEGKYKEISEISAKITQQSTVQFNNALEAGARKAEQLRERLDLVKSTIEGISREQSLFLFDTSNTSDETQKQIRSSSLLNDEQKAQAIALQQELVRLSLAEREHALREDLAKTEQKIADIREKDRKSQFITLEALSQKLQINALSDDPQKKRLEEALKEREDQLNALAQNRIADSRLRRGDDIGNIGVQFRDGFMSRPDGNDKRIDPLERMLEQTLTQGFFEMTKEQKNTTKAIEKAEFIPRAG